MLENLPNLLSWLRIALVPAVVIFFWIPCWGGLIAAILFTLAASLDLLDGYVARLYSVDSDFGRFIDPVADKLLIVSALIAILVAPDPPAARWILGILSLTIILREIVISSLRAWAGGGEQSDKLAVLVLAKCKTAIQMVAIIALFLSMSFHELYLDTIGVVLLFVGAVVGLLSMVEYFRNIIGGK